jgi:hypothetical protein
VVTGEIDFDLTALGFGFLQAKHVWLMCLHECLKHALLHDGANAVDVPRIQFH